jgi:hypothetical protein
MDHPDMIVQNSTSAISNAPIKGGVATSSSLSMPHSSLPFPVLGNNDATKKVELTRGDRIVLALKAYCGSLIRVGVILPVIASSIVVALYLTLPNSPVSFLGVPPNSQWYTLVYSSFLTGIIWLLAAFPCSYLSTAQSANPRNYSLLKSRLHRLKASLGLKDYVDGAYEEINTIETVMDQAGFKDQHQREAVKEACACCIDISRKLYKFSAGPAWIIGTGYNSAWTLLHHAEEAMFEVADVETLVRGAKHDFLAIEGSHMNGQDELLANVTQAVAVLKPEVSIYFKEHQPSKSSLAKGQSIQHPQISNPPPPDGNGSNKNVEGPDTQANAEAAARAMLREVRSTLNDFRDNRWEGLVRQRSRLLKSIAITGIVTHVLLCITILINAPPEVAAHKQFTDLTAFQKGIMAATLFYMVGAIAGLFVRFYAESRAVASIDDFGLSTIRLVALPLLSGLAGVGGVLVAVMIAALGGPALIGSIGAPAEQSIQLSAIFSLNSRLLLTAAIFGVAPNLLIRGLQQKANEYATELKGSTAAVTQGSGVKV